MNNYEQLYKYSDGAFLVPRLVDIVTEEIPPQNVQKSHRDYPQRLHEPAEAHGEVDQNRAPQLGIDRAVEEEQVEGQEQMG